MPKLEWSERALDHVRRNNRCFVLLGACFLILRPAEAHGGYFLMAFQIWLLPTITIVAILAPVRFIITFPNRRDPSPVCAFLTGSVAGWPTNFFICPTFLGPICNKLTPQSTPSSPKCASCRRIRATLAPQPYTHGHMWA